MRFFLKIMLLFLAISLASNFFIQIFHVEFGTVSYWQNRGIWFLIFMFFFPRLTLLFSSVVSTGFFWWLGWLICPRFLTAILATIAYWQTNKILVLGSWLWVLGLETTEKYYASRRVTVVRTSRHKIDDENVIDV